MNTRIQLPRTGRLVGLALALAATLPACAPLVVGGAMVGGAMVAMDRRTTATQLEDQTIELKAANRIAELNTLGHVNVTSYNRTLLLTGEVPTDAARGQVESTVSAIDNVRAVVNEVAVMGNSSTTARANDALLTTKVKATLVEAADLRATAIKVLTERGTVFLMGRVTERESARAGEVASTVPGVQKVVRVFESITEEERARLEPAPPKK